jgi:hypothetical protein
MLRPTMTNSSENDSSPAKESVEKWLEKAGYPLEFYVASVFSKHGFDVSQGAFLPDTTTGEPRELDVIAGLQAQVEDTRIHFAHVVECKSSRAKPWVIFTSSAARSTYALRQCVTDPWGEFLLWLSHANKEVGATEMFDETRLPRVGFAATAAHADPEKRNEADRVYDAVQQVSSATKAIVEPFSTFARDAGIGIGKAPRDTMLARAVLVIEAPLFEAHYDPTQTSRGGMVVNSLQTARLRWTGASGPRFGVTIDVVTKDALEVFVKTRAREATEIMRHLGEAHQRACRSTPEEFANLEGAIRREHVPDLLRPFVRGT